jgi:hypothetical protein
MPHTESATTLGLTSEFGPMSADASAIVADVTVSSIVLCEYTSKEKTSGLISLAIALAAGIPHGQGDQPGCFLFRCVFAQDNGAYRNIEKLYTFKNVSKLVSAFTVDDQSRTSTLNFLTLQY